MRRKYKLELLWIDNGWKYSASYRIEKNAVKVGKMARDRLANCINFRVTNTETGEVDNG